ncbi:uroporphyrinogen decarboxylase family protein [Eubacteriaceae bacterium ES3]|nr:uroporphyrinogen decarboxylase family protein [Eubacteriaceae bacterium ES3]
MTSLTRVMETVAFNEVDRVPVVPQIFGHAGVLSGIPLHKFVKSGDLIAQAQLKVLDYYQADGIFLVTDVNVECEAAGSILDYPNDQLPVVKSPVLVGKTVADLRVPDPQVSGRMPEILKAIRICKAAIGEESLIIGCVMGPMTLALLMMGIEAGLYLAADDLDAFKQVLEYAKQVSAAYGLAQLQAGAHLVMVFDPSSTPEIIPPQFFRELVKDPLAELFQVLKSGGGMANFLHITGDNRTILPYYSEMGVEIAGLDYPVDMAEAAQILPDICLIGNILPADFLSGTPEIINEKAESLLEAFSDRGGFILSSGCEIYPNSKPENIMAMINQVKNK